MLQEVHIRVVTASAVRTSGWQHVAVRQCCKHAVEEPWNSSRVRICRIAGRRIYQAIGAEHVRYRRPAAPDVVLCRLLSLDYVLEQPHAAWLPTEDEKETALTAAAVARELLPRRLYQGTVGARYRYFLHRRPMALDAARATFLFVQAEDETESGPHVARAARGAVGGAGRGRPRRRGGCGGRGRGASSGGRPGAREMGGDASRSRDAVSREAASELAAIKKAVATSDWDALETYGGLNPAIKRACVHGAACAGDRRSRAAITTGRTWRSKRVPEWIPTGRAYEAVRREGPRRRPTCQALRLLHCVPAFQVTRRPPGAVIFVCARFGCPPRIGSPGSPMPRRAGRWVAGSAGAGRLGGGPRVGLSEASRGRPCPSRQLATSGDACVGFGPNSALSAQSIHSAGLAGIVPNLRGPSVHNFELDSITLWKTT